MCHSSPNDRCMFHHSSIPPTKKTNEIAIVTSNEKPISQGNEINPLAICKIDRQKSRQKNLIILLTIGWLCAVFNNDKGSC